VFDKGGDVTAQLVGFVQLTTLQRLQKKTRKTGFLIKKGGKRRNWKRRWFELTEQVMRFSKCETPPFPYRISFKKGEISYFESQSTLDKPLKTFVVLSAAPTEHAGKKVCVVVKMEVVSAVQTLTTTPQMQNVIAIETYNRRLLVCADNDTEMREWIQSLNSVNGRS